eukprot:834774-Rhodomonas_salina.1
MRLSGYHHAQEEVPAKPDRNPSALRTRIEPPYMCKHVPSRAQSAGGVGPAIAHQGLVDFVHIRQAVDGCEEEFFELCFGVAWQVSAAPQIRHQRFCDGFLHHCTPQPQISLPSPSLLPPPSSSFVPPVPIFACLCLTTRGT